MGDSNGSNRDSEPSVRRRGGACHDLQSTTDVLPGVILEHARRPRVAEPRRCMRAGFVMSLVSIRTTADFWFARVLSARTSATAAF